MTRTRVGAGTAVLVLGLGSAAWAEHGPARVLDRLEQVTEELAHTGAEPARETAERLHLDAAGPVTVVLELEDGAPVPPLEAVEGALLAQAGPAVRVAVPLERLPGLRALPGVRVARAPLLAVEVEGPGLPAVEPQELPGLVALQADGATGRGVKLAVLARGFTPGSPGARQVQAVLALAPDVELHAISLADDVDLRRALEDLRAQDIRVVLHPLGWVDGAGQVDGWVNQSVQAGALWVVPAGTLARRHWKGPWRDTNGNRLLEFAPGREAMPLLPGPGPVSVFLSWTGAQGVDLDLVVRNRQGRVVARSQAAQDAWQPAREAVGLTLLAHEGPASVEVRRYRGSTSALTVSLFSLDHDLAQPVAAAALLEPASAAAAFTVGVAGPSSGSCAGTGPTVDGRPKPDLVLPAWTVHNPEPAPCGAVLGAAVVAAGAALLLEREPTLDRAGLAARLPSLLEAPVRDGGTVAVVEVDGGVAVQAPDAGVLPEAVVASDGFESGKWVGGRGWTSAWRTDGSVSLRADQGPPQGRYHARLRGPLGRLERTLDLRGATRAELDLRVRGDGLVPGDRAVLEVGRPDGPAQVVAELAEVDGGYQEVHAPLPAGSALRVSLVLTARGTDARLFVDDVQVKAR